MEDVFLSEEATQRRRSGSGKSRTRAEAAQRRGGSRPEKGYIDEVVQERGGGEKL